jgi:hypothetical protein
VARVLNSADAIFAYYGQKLMEARVVVADLTTKNPNVFYELGLAHTLGHEVVLLTQNMDEIPFDLRHLRCHDYTPDTSGLSVLRQKLHLAFNELLR